MTTPSEILSQMIDNVESQSGNLASSISQVQDQIDDLTEQIDGVENGLCTVAETDLTSYLDGTKLTELEILYGGSLPYYVDYGANYGEIDYTTGGITDWQIKDDDDVVVYEYEGTNWDSDPYIIKRVTDYAFGNDYLTRPLTSGASYGLYPAKANLEIAKALLQENKTKVEASETTFEDYAT